MHVQRLKAEKLRSEGYSYNLISQKLNVPKGTLSYWFKGKHFVPNKEVLDRTMGNLRNIALTKHNKMLKEIDEMKQLGTKDIGVLSERDLMMLGVGLYIGEGSKTSEMIRIANSDPRVIRLAVRWLQSIGLDLRDIGISLHIYPDNDQNAAVKYWLEEAGLDKSNLRWISVDRRTNKSPRSIRKLPHGTAHLSVISGGDKEKGVRLFRRLNGWIIGTLNQV